MSTVIRSTTLIEAGKWIVETETTPSATWTETDIQNSIDTALNGAYDATGGWVIAPTTVNEICAIPWLFNRWLMLISKYRVTSDERINSDGTIVKVWTITEP